MRLLSVLGFAAILLPACARAEPPGWQQFPIIEWQMRQPAALATLKRIGVTDGVITADRADPRRLERQQVANLRAAGMGFDVENIATDFYSAYHRWFPHKPVNWRFVAAQQQYRADPSDRRLLFRDPSFSDPLWLARIRQRLMTTVRLYAPFHPLYYDLGDETGIADLTAFWDFDLSPRSIAGMQRWLRTQYPSLAALNAEWGTDYASWTAVQPETTRRAMRRTDGNFAPWSDFKSWMDVSYARALRAGTDTVHAADPHALAAIEGAQMPGWGGYDYVNLAHAVDLMEVTASGRETLPLLHALNPRLIPIVTSFATDPAALRRIWHAVLNGARGLVLWDADKTIVRTDGTVGPDGQIYAPLFARLHRLGPILGTSTPLTDPVAILYSPESFRLQWMLDQQPKGDAWMQRKSETELEPNPWRNALRGYMHALDRLHLQPRFISTAMLPTLRARVLILPDTLSLSSRDVAAIARFAAHGGMVVADRTPGVFDGHGKRLAQPALAAGIARIVAPEDATELGRLAGSVGVHPEVVLRNPDGSSAVDVTVYRYRHGGATLLALERGDQGNAPRQVVLALPKGMTLRHALLGGPAQRSGGTVTVTLDPVEPSILALSHAPAGRR